MVESALASVVGPEHVLTDPELRAGAEVDWTGRWRGTARAVVRPGTPAEVAAVLAACAGGGVPVVPQGGNTGLVGGGVPAGVDGAVVLSTRRLTGLAPVAGGRHRGGRRGRDDRRGAGARRRGRLAARHGLGRPGLGHGRRRDRDQRRRPAGAALGTGPGPAGRGRGRAGRRRAAVPGRTVRSRTPPATTCPGCCAAARARSGCSPGCGCGWCRRCRPSRAVALVGVPGIARRSRCWPAVRRAVPDLAAAEIIGAVRAGRCSTCRRRCPAAGAAYVLVEVVGTVDELAEALAGADGGRGRGARRRTRPTGPGCGATGRRSSPAVTAAGVPVKLDVSLPAARLAEVWDALPALVGAGRTVLYRTPGRVQPARQPARTCRTREDEAIATGCCGWSPRPAGRSAPSTGSAGPRRPGCT